MRHKEKPRFKQQQSNENFSDEEEGANGADKKHEPVSATLGAKYGDHTAKIENNPKQSNYNQEKMTIDRFKF